MRFLELYVPSLWLISAQRLVLTLTSFALILPAAIIFSIFVVHFGEETGTDTLGFIISIPQDI